MSMNRLQAYREEEGGERKKERKKEEKKKNIGRIVQDKTNNFQTGVHRKITTFNDQQH